MTSLSGGAVHPTEVRRAGVRIERDPGEAVDVELDGQWVWSFNAARDAVRGKVPWPEVMVPHLRGRSRVVLRGHNTREVLFDAEVTFTADDRRVELLDRWGNHVAVDKSGRLQRKFDDTADEVRSYIVEAVDRILHDLRTTAGLDAFLAFGCLLGAIRNGKMIGHDADADVAYLSRHTQPLDIILENRAAARAMRSLGYQVVQMSGADFKIWVPLRDGRRCGVDVFGGYHFGGDFYLLPTVHGHLERSSLLPPATVSLEGRDLVAPAVPEDLLAVTYGPSWRVPDPSFQYEHPRWLTRHMNGYWRGDRNHMRSWSAFYAGPQADRVPDEPSPFARWVSERLDDDHDLVDVGAGNGRDAVHFAAGGRRVLALDYIPKAFPRVRRLARRRGVQVEVGRVNLYEPRSTLVVGARLAHDPRPRHVYARLVLEGVNSAARTEFFRFADMATRRGGSTFVEFRVRGRLTADRVVDEAAARGAVIEHREVGRDLAPYRNQNPVVCRLVMRWKR